MSGKDYNEGPDEYFDEQDEYDLLPEDFEDVSVEYEESLEDFEEGPNAYDKLTEDFNDIDDFIYDEEGHSEPVPNVYYYKDEENYEEDMVYEEPEDEEEVTKKKKKMSLCKKILLGIGIFLFLLILFILFIVFTPVGQRLGIGCVAGYLREKMGGVPDVTDGDIANIIKIPDPEFEKTIIGPENTTSETVTTGPRSEEYVKTFLIFGIEEIDGASNTDAILLMSINKKDNTIKMTSLLRDTYVDIPGDYANKINSVYARGCKRTDDPKLKKAAGAALLVNVIENTYDVDISGYACVNFSSFEKIVDRLGGIDIQLGEKEAKYLRKTNYISNPAYRTVQAGWNHMNGNQVLGYCRVRKVVTLGGANNDYGRTVRHRRVINAIIDKFKSTSIFDMIPIMNDCLGYIYTNLTAQQIEDALVDIVDNSIFTTASMRLPADELFTDSGKTGINNGKSNITYALVLGDKVDENIKKFHEFLFLDEEKTEEAPADGGSQTTGGTQTGSPTDTATGVTTGPAANAPVDEALNGR
ncbi:MAG: LCP family protein [Lachnospiraceae bacterium]|nr:LCP family protein [Lachnospiraceae bacterium]